MFAGSEWTFYHPVRVGTPIQATMQLAEVIEKTGRFAGRQILQIDESIYRDAAGEILATARNPVMRTERQTAQDKGKYARIKPKRWTPDELQAIDDELAQQQPRGRHAALLARRQRRRRADASSQRPPHHHRLHRLADGLGLAIRAAAPGGVSVPPAPPGGLYRRRPRRTRRSRAGALGRGLRPRRRRAGRLRLRARSASPGWAICSAIGWATMAGCTP